MSPRLRATRLKPHAAQSINCRSLAGGSTMNSSHIQGVVLSELANSALELLQACSNLTHSQPCRRASRSSTACMHVWPGVRVVVVGAHPNRRSWPVPQHNCDWIGPHAGRGQRGSRQVTRPPCGNCKWRVMPGSCRLLLKGSSRNRSSPSNAYSCTCINTVACRMVICRRQCRAERNRCRYRSCHYTQEMVSPSSQWTRMSKN